MPVTCIVVDCGSRGDRDRVEFFSVPTMLNHRFITHKNELSQRRRARWLAAIKREDLTEKKIKYQRVCSKHFITGKPAALEDENDPDWVPSQYMGHKSQSFNKRPNDVKRNQRLAKRKKLQVEEDEPSENIENNDIEDNEEEQATGFAAQTEITMENLETKLEQLQFASKKIADLEGKVENFPFGLMDEKSNIDKWKYYTAFTYEVVNEVIFSLVEKYISSTSTTVLSPFNQLLLTLIKLRLDLHFRDLAYRFKIAPTTASTYFMNVVEVLYKRLKSLIIWPDRSVSQKNVPLCFQEAFQNKTTVIIDCFEVFIQKPASLLTQQQCWSNYKHHRTVKFLIGITPQGTISYISEAWGGRASDKQIVERSKFCDYLKPGDVVLADRGFLIRVYWCTGSKISYTRLYQRQKSVASYRN